MECTIEERKDYFIVNIPATLEGEEEVRKSLQLVDLTLQKKGIKIVIDVASVSTVTSNILGLILQLAQLSQVHKVGLELSGVSAKLKATFDALLITKLFQGFGATIR